VFKTIYDDPERWWEAYEMAEKLIDVEESFQLWRFRHMKTVERTIGHKTGRAGRRGRIPAAGRRSRVLPGADRSANLHRSTVEIVTGAPDAFERVSGSEPLTEALVRERVSPLFSRVLEAQRGRIYLANHSLGRPLDATADDVREGLALWYARLGDAWDDWAAEMTAYRSRLAALAGAPRADSIVPKTSAGQGLRAVLNTYDRAPRVVATRGEFDSLDVILREYARRGRVALTFVEPDAGGLFGAQDVLDAIAAGADCS
jgi:hypothetical protein